MHLWVMKRTVLYFEEKINKRLRGSGVKLQELAANGLRSRAQECPAPQNLLPPCLRLFLSLHFHVTLGYLSLMSQPHRAIGRMVLVEIFKERYMPGSPADTESQGYPPTTFKDLKCQ